MTGELRDCCIKEKHLCIYLGHIWDKILYHNRIGQLMRWKMRVSMVPRYAGLLNILLGELFYLFMISHIPEYCDVVDRDIDTMLSYRSGLRLFTDESVDLDQRFSTSTNDC